MKKIYILGAAGFLGSHLEHRLKAEGHYVVSVARKLPPFRKSVADELNFLDLTNPADFHSHFFRHSFDEVYQLAGNVGGLGHIAVGDNDAAILTESTKINLHTLEAITRTQSAGKILFASSQCVYPDIIEDGEHSPPAEEDASFNTFPFAQEKLYAEKLYDAYARNHGLKIAIARLGNIYGPYSTYDGARAKAPAAICRKVAQASYGGTVELWGDGTQTRSFTYVDNAIEGMIRLMAADYPGPVNIAHSETVTIAELFDSVLRVAGKILAPKWIDGPTGVMARGSDNTLCRSVLQWEPTTSLFNGLSETYHWIAKQVLTKANA